MKTFNTYLDIKKQREVVIGEDYPYTNLPSLPCCETLVIRNANIRTIETQPRCYDVDIISCLPKNKGQLEQIGDLPVCSSLSVYASKFRQIGAIDHCDQLRLINVHNRKPLIDIPAETVILKDSDSNILYISSEKLLTREVIDEILDQGLPLADIDFTKSRLYDYQNPQCIDFKNMDFSGIQIENVNFEWCDLRGANFEKAQLHHVTFEHCFFDLANFRQVDFSSTVIKHCSFERANLEGAIITPDMVGYLDKCNIEGVDVFFEGERLQLTEWHGENTPCNKIDNDISVVLRSTNGHVYFVGRGGMTFMDTMRRLLAEKRGIIGLDLSDVTCGENWGLSCISFAGHTLTNTKICDCNLQFVSFKGSYLDNVLFENCNFITTDFRDLNLEKVNFSECTFSDATLFDGSTISPQLASLLAELTKLPANVLVKTQGTEPTPLEQFVSPVPENNFDTLWDNQNLYLLFKDRDKTELCFAGKEIDCYRRLSDLQMETVPLIVGCDIYFNQHLHSSKMMEVCEQILGFKNDQNNQDSQYNVANHLDQILVDVMSEALQSSYFNVLKECSDFIQNKGEFLYQSVCFLENNRIEINLKLHTVEHSSQQTRAYKSIKK